MSFPVEDLNIYITTFNCARLPIKPEAFAAHFFDALPGSETNSEPGNRGGNNVKQPDLIMLSLQEIAPLAEAFNGHESLTKYFDLFDKAVQLAAKLRFGDDGHNSNSNGKADISPRRYTEVKTSHIGLTAIMLFVRSEIKHQIGDVLVGGVGVGILKTGNKGGVGLRVSWRNPEPTLIEGIDARYGAGDSRGQRASNSITYLTFVAAHLAPMEEATERRNQDYRHIVAGLVFEDKSSSDKIGTDGEVTTTSEQEGEEESKPLLSTPPSSPPSSSSSSSPSSSLIGIYSPDTHLFLAGDLNYRTSTTPPTSESTFPQPYTDPTSPSHYLNLLLPHDQLTHELHSGRTLHGLTECPITFPPTYKYSSTAVPRGQDFLLDSDTTVWKWSSHRWPSWCDRILFSSSSSSPSSSVSVTTGIYTALPLLSTSDHRPVALSCSVPQRPVWNPDGYVTKRPVGFDPLWKSNRAAAEWKEGVVGTVWGVVGSGTGDGVLNLAVFGVVAVVGVAVLVAVYGGVL